MAAVPAEDQAPLRRQVVQPRQREAAVTAGAVAALVPRRRLTGCT
jgi:hypothetical protein